MSNLIGEQKEIIGKIREIISSSDDLFLRFHDKTHDILVSEKISGHEGDPELDPDFLNHENYCEEEDCSLENPCELLEEILENYVFFEGEWYYHPEDGVCCFSYPDLPSGYWEYEKYGSLTIFKGKKVDSSIIDVPEGDFACVNEIIITLSFEEDKGLWKKLVEMI